MASEPRPFDVDVDVVASVRVNVGVSASALAERQTPPSFAALVPFNQTISVFPVASAESSTMSLMLRLPVHGLSKQPSMPVPERTAIRSTVIDALGPVAALRRYRPRKPSGGIAPPNGASAPRPMTPPAVPTNNWSELLGLTMILLMLRPLKAGTFCAMLLASR